MSESFLSELHSQDDLFEEARRRIFLLGHPLFYEVSPESPALDEFLHQIKIKKFSKGELIYRQNQPPVNIYLIRDGEIHIERADPLTRERFLVGIGGRGSLFGEASFMSGRPRTSDARAAMESIVYVIPGTVFMNLMNREPTVGRELSQILARHLRTQIEQEMPGIPAQIFTLLYPEKPRRGSELSRLLGAMLVKQCQGPIALCAFGRHSIFNQEQGVNLTRIMDSWPNMDIDRIRKMIASPLHTFDVLKGDALFSPGTGLEKMARDIPALLGRMKKYYQAIIVDAGADFDHPVNSRIISQSDNIIMVRQVNRPIDPMDDGFARWNKALYHCSTLSKDFYDRVITISDEPAGTSLRILNRSINRYSNLYSRNIRMQSEESEIFDENDPVLKKGVGRLARRLSGTSRGLCLGGGGSRAMAHAGVIEVFEAEGLDFDAVGGTSMGSVLGAAYAMGLNSGEIKYLLKQILPDSGAILDKAMPLISFFRGKKLSKAILKAFGEKRFEELEIPFFCNGSDLSSGSQVLFEKGFLSTAIRASVSLPGVFPPMKLGNYRIVDGGVLNNLPGDILRDKGYNRIIGVNVTPLEDVGSAQTDLDARKGILQGLRDYLTLPPILKIIYRSITMEGRALLKFRMEDFDFVLHPEISGYDVFDFHLQDEIIERGRESALKNIGEIKAALSRQTEIGS